MKAYFLNNKWKCHRSTIQSTKKIKNKSLLCFKFQKDRWLSFTLKVAKLKAFFKLLTPFHQPRVLETHF